MQDFQFNAVVDQRARGTIEVLDYDLLNGQVAEGTLEVIDYEILEGISDTGIVEVLDYTKLIEATASGSIVIDDYALLLENEAIGGFTITDYSLLEGVTVTVNGVEYVEGVHFDAVSSNNQTATNLAAAINPAVAVNAVADSADVNITAAEAGSAGNAIGLSTDAEAGITVSGETLAGGRDNAVFTVNGTEYVAGDDFTVETDNATTAGNLEAEVDDDTGLATGVTDNAISIAAASAGSAGNAIDLIYDGDPGGATISGSTLEGGQDHAEITIGDDTIVQGTDFTAATNEATTAESIKDAIDGLTGLSATRDGDEVNVVNDAFGAVGKSLVYVGAEGGIALSDSLLTGGQAAGTVTVGATVLVEGSDFDAESDNDTTAENIKDAIHAISGISATRSGSVVTIVKDAIGVDGNEVALEATPAEAVDLSGGTLEGGRDAGTITVGGTTLTEGSDFSAETDNDTTATNIATAIDGLSGVNATADGSIVTVINDASGVAGNSVALECSVVEAVELSGATLLGGVAATYSDVFDFSTMDEPDNMEIVGFLDEVAGNTPTVTITPEYSMDKVNFFSHASSFSTAFSVIDTPQVLDYTFTGLYLRFKIVHGGTNTVSKPNLKAIVR